MARSVLFVPLLAAFIAAPTAAPASTARVVEETLPNGMRVLVREDHKAPVVISNLWVRVGSNDETPEVRGCSHLIEHMIFNKGTKRRGVGDLGREVSEAGGEHNAGTGYETTNYFITLPSENFEIALDLQSDALTSSVFDAGELDKEREVVIEENNLYADEPTGYGKTWMRLMESAFTTSPYQRSIGGPDSLIRIARRDDILAYKNRYYVPSNMTLVVVGDIATSDVLRKAGAAFKDFECPPAPTHSVVKEPPQTGMRYLAYTGDVSQAYMKFGYHLPGEIAEDQPAIRVLSEILAQGQSSRVYRNVREDQGLISSIDVLSETGPNEGYVILDAVAETHDAARAEEAILGEIERLKRDRVSDDEITKARHQVLRAYLLGLETVDGQAGNLGYYDMMGDYTYAHRYPDLVNAVTPEDVREVARRYFDLDNLTLGVYYPTSDEGKIETDAAAVRARLTSALAAASQGAPESPEAVPPAPRLAVPPGRSGSASPAPTERAHEREHADTVLGRFRGLKDGPIFGSHGQEGGVVRYDLPNGLILLVKENTSVPIVAAGAFARVGTRNETAATNGIAPLTQRVMLKGTHARSAERIASEMELLGGTLEPFADADASGCMMTILADQFSAGFEILADVFNDPVFPVDATNREREIMKSEIEASKDNTILVALQEFRSLVFGAHPYGLPRLGTPENLDRLTPTDLERWRETYYAPNNMIVCIVGDVRPNDARAVVERAFGGLAPRAVPDAPAAALPPPAARERTVEKDVKQDVLVIGGLGPRADEPDSRVMDVISAALEGTGNRLFTELRDKRSLCYYTGLFYHEYAAAGAYGGYIGTAPSKEAGARAALSEQMRLVSENGLTDEEVSRAKKTLIGNFAIMMQSNEAQMQEIANDVILGLGRDAFTRYESEVRAVTPRAVSAALARYVDVDRASVVTVRPPQP